MQLIHADNASLEAWRQDDLKPTLAILSQVTQGPGAEHYRLANLAVIKARLKQWDEAEQDVRAVTSSCSLFAYPLTLLPVDPGPAYGPRSYRDEHVLSSQGKLASAKQEFNKAFLCDEPKNNCLLLLIKVPYRTDLCREPSC